MDLSVFYKGLIFSAAPRKDQARWRKHWKVSFLSWLLLFQHRYRGYFLSGDTFCSGEVETGHHGNHNKELYDCLDSMWGVQNLDNERIFKSAKVCLNDPNIFGLKCSSRGIRAPSTDQCLVASKLVMKTFQFEINTWYISVMTIEKNCLHKLIKMVWYYCTILI